MALEGLSDHALHERFELLKGAEHHKNDLIMELLRRIDNLSNDYQQMSLDHQRETQFNREGQLRERQLKDELRKLQSFMVLPFSAVHARIATTESEKDLG
ncbi:MAG: hypothetical protein LQ343_006581 [Gyalolechia ehrenbergii]|nr:MAG: hypothetical protein LQ343_006581 [Gyalolechia ehrenbergii]